MRCSDCNKFVGNEEQEPEVNSLEIDEEGHVTISVRIANACDQCSTELTEAELEMENDVDVEAHKKACEDMSLSIEETAAERGTKTEGKGRGTKTFYGATVSYSVTCDTCDEQIAEGSMSDFVQASCMEVLT